MPEARRTIVKSPPELWAEVSDAEALGRHLEAFGEIRITRLEPEATVAWEGDRARGTVALAPSGWGTRVTVTAEPVEEPEPEEPELEVADATETTEEPEPEPEPTPDPEPEPEPAAEAPVVEQPKRRGFWARVFRRGRVTEVPALAEPAAEEATVAAEEADEPAAEAPRVEVPDVEPEVTASAAATDREPREPFDGLDRAVLAGMLDSLGAAHHRPFSR